MQKRSVIILSIFSFFILSSCQKLKDPGATVAVKMANEWWVTLTVDGADIYGIGHFKLATYNTSENGNQIWVDDLEHGWQFKVKANADYNNLTFNTTQAQNEYYDIKVDLANGKVLPDVGRSKSGNVTDSIYMEARFSDDSTTNYVMSGHARTKFVEDEY